MKTITIPVLAMLFAIFTASITAQTVTVLNFEDEDETSEIIDHLHTDDWQTDLAYTRNTFALNPNKTGINTSDRCASFAGYSSDSFWWYGFDIVLTDSIPLTAELKYVHAMMMTNDTSVDTNRGLLLLTSNGGEIAQKWGNYVTGEWADYVFPIPAGTTNIGELRFMFNHKTDGQITYLDEIVVNNDPNPRTILAGNDNVQKTNGFYVYSADRKIIIMLETNSLLLEIYNLMGHQIFSGIIHESETSIPVINSGVYLVKGDKTIQKLMVQ